MNLFKTIFSFLILFCFFSQSKAGDIKGNVRLEGKVPSKYTKPKLIDRRQDPKCGPDGSKVFKRKIKLDPNGGLEESIVYLRNVDYKGKAPENIIELDQKGCVYTPHVFGIQVGQKLLVKNNDPTLHNIHSMPKKNREFNFAMPAQLKEKPTKFDTAEDPFYIKCDVHPWMQTWVLVSDHPYFAVTDSNGNYEIKGVPAGTYEIVCWQEFYNKPDHKWRKPIVRTITIDSNPSTENFIFTGPPKKPKGK